MELLIAIVAIVVLTILRFTVTEHSLWLIIFAFVVGAWLTFRPSEWAVEGLDSGAKYTGVSDYVAGIVSSLASNLPEAIIAIFLIIAGNAYVAIITVLSAAGFNTLILGSSILVATRKKGYIDVPEDLEKKEAPIIRWAVVALSMTTLLGLIEISQISGDQKAEMDWPIAALLALSYLIYMVFLFVEKEEDNTLSEAEKEKPKHSKLLTVVFLLIGFAGIFYGGETLSFATESILENFTINETVVALILGAVGAIPENGIAVILAMKSEVDIALGNAIGGILQTILLVFGILGTILGFISPVELKPFIIIQLAAAAAVLWFVKRSIFDDKKFDIFEGVMIILLQLFVFAIMFEEIVKFG